MNEKVIAELRGHLRAALAVLESARRLAAEAGKKETANEITQSALALIATTGRLK